jgi:hypothetical protein
VGQSPPLASHKPIAWSSSGKRMLPSVSKKSLSSAVQMEFCSDACSASGTDGRSAASGAGSDLSLTTLQRASSVCVMRYNVYDWLVLDQVDPVNDKHH